MNFFTKRSFESIKESSTNSGLKKNLSAFDLILLGLGLIIGSGVFVFTGLVAAKHSGPAVIISYAIAGITCIFVALAYAELAVMLPTSGSVYSYSYIAFGELIAWLMGAILVLELSLGASAVAAGWSAYVQGLFEISGLRLPSYLSDVYSNGGGINLPAMLISFIVGVILYQGTKDTKKLNAILVSIKMIAISVFIVSAVPNFNLSYWHDFMPYGFDNVMVGASTLFFAFTGFGALATTAEECNNPKRDLIIGIVGSLVLSTLIYMIIAGLTTGIAPIDKLNDAQALAKALQLNGNNIGSVIVAIGAVCGMTTVIMMNIYAQSRVLYVMARDGLLPRFFGHLHPRYNNPHTTILFLTIITALISGFAPYDIVGQLSSMGSLIDYIVISLIVMIFRVKYPELPRSFKCPGLFVIAPIALVACTYLLFKQILKNGELLFTGKILFFWVFIVLILYLLYKLGAKIQK